jgi:RNA polymerase sigma factor (sigma-70 family)
LGGGKIYHEIAFMSEETKFFAEFAASRSETAFAAIVRLHLNLVFATALRQAGDCGLAEEITQNVFLTLAQKAGTLRWDTTLAGWLYQTTINHSRQQLRAELRRQNREQVAAALATASHDGESIWAGLAPLLDEALLALQEKDRLAVVLHFMEERPFREVGDALGVGEDAARKRTQRVLENLIEWFRQRGFAIPSGALIALLSVKSLDAVPAGFAATIASACVLSSAALTGSTLSIFGVIMASTNWKLAIAALALALGITSPLLLRERNSLPAGGVNDVLDQSPAVENPSSAEFAPRASSPETVALPQDALAPPPILKSFLERLNDGDMSLSMLSAEQADAFLALNKTNSQSLLAAYRVTHNLDYLRRAATNFPTDPAVLLRVAIHDAFPEDRRAWLEQLKKADSENALPNYLSASDHWKNNEIDLALQDLTAASNKAAFKDYLTDHMQTLEEVYLSAGHTAGEAKALATCAVEMPHVSQTVEMAKKMAQLATSYQQSGDSASADNLTRFGLIIAQHLNGVQDGGNLLGQAVGVAVEQRFLSRLAPDQSYPFISGTAGERMNALNAREQAIRQDSQFIGRWIPQATDQEIISYFDRLKLYGESAAIEWLKNRTPNR